MVSFAVFQGDKRTASSDFHLANEQITVSMPNNLQADVEVTITPTLPENSFVGTPVTAPALVPVTLIQREADIQPQRVRIMALFVVRDEGHVI